MSRFLRYLRIAFSATCLIVCVLLIVLWVRSYWWWDKLITGAGRNIDSLGGRLMIDEEIGISSPQWVAFPRGHIPGSSIEWVTFGKTNTIRQGIGTAIPDWLLVLVSGILATAPWLHKLRWRFSLRTLLIAMTLVAVVLGLIVWMSRTD